MMSAFLLASLTALTAGEQLTDKGLLRPAPTQLLLAGDGLGLAKADGLARLRNLPLLSLALLHEKAWSGLPALPLGLNLERTDLAGLKGLALLPKSDKGLSGSAPTQLLLAGGDGLALANADGLAGLRNPSLPSLPLFHDKSLSGLPALTLGLNLERTDLAGLKGLALLPKAGGLLEAGLGLTNLPNKQLLLA